MYRARPPMYLTRPPMYRVHNGQYVAPTLHWLLPFSLRYVIMVVTITHYSYLEGDFIESTGVHAHG